MSKLVNDTCINSSKNLEAFTGTKRIFHICDIAVSFLSPMFGEQIRRDLILKLFFQSTVRTERHAAKVFNLRSGLNRTSDRCWLIYSFVKIN